MGEVSWIKIQLYGGIRVERHIREERGIRVERGMRVERGIDDIWWSIGYRSYMEV